MATTKSIFAVEDAAAGSGRDLAFAEHELLTQSQWSHVVAGIMMAGAVYPFVLAILWSFWSFIAILVPAIFEADFSVVTPDLWYLPFALGFFAISAGAVGMVWSGTVAALVLTIAYLLAWMLKLRGRMVWLGAVTGGCVGFLSILPFLHVGAEMLSTQIGGGIWMMVAGLLCGPGVATIMGQIGGARGGQFADALAEADRRRKLIRARWIDEAIHAASSPPLEPEPATITPSKKRLQFGIRHLLWLSVWLSLLLTAIRLSGIPFEFILPLFGGWLVFQGLSLWAGVYLVRRLVPWWHARRQHRST